MQAGNYAAAFAYLGPVTDPERGENRDVFLFPETLRLDGSEMYTALIRPQENRHYPAEPA